MLTAEQKQQLVNKYTLEDEHILCVFQGCKYIRLQSKDV